MSFAFEPKNDLCIDCSRLIKPKAERNYIVWDGRHPRYGGQCYRRECAECHDKRLNRPLIENRLTRRFRPKEVA